VAVGGAGCSGGGGGRTTTTPSFRSIGIPSDSGSWPDAAQSPNATSANFPAAIKDLSPLIKPRWAPGACKLGGGAVVHMFDT